MLFSEGYECLYYDLYMRRLYFLLALILMGSGGYLLYKGKDVGAALVGAGVTAVTIQQVEDHKQRERLDRQRQSNELVENRVDELKQQVDVLKIENNILRERIEKKDTEISELKVNKAVLETRLEYTEDPYYMRAKLDNPALPESNIEEFKNHQYQVDEAQYNEIEIEEDEDHV